MDHIEKQLETLTGDIQGFMKKMEAEQKTTGAIAADTKASFEAMVKRQDDLEQRLSDFRASSQQKVRTLADEVRESESVQRLIRDGGRGRAHLSLKGDAAREIMEHKSTITSSSVGFPTAGVMPAEMGSYVPEARKTLRMRDVIPSRSITVGQYSWPKYSVTGTKASPVAEASQKPINTFDPTTVTERVKTIATYFKTGRQVLEDYSELAGILRSLGSYKYMSEMDAQILSGSNSGENLNGLITQAQAFDSALLSAATGYTYFDQLNAAAQQVAEDDEGAPTFFVLHPRDWFKMTRLKDSNKQYLLDGPQGNVTAQGIWGMTPVVTTQISSGTFLVGNGTPVASEFRNRMELEVAISTEDADNFTYNLVTIRFEGRGLLAVYRPDQFVTGSFLNSPAQS
jgi:HK97 family phage major capsid protein